MFLYIGVVGCVIGYGFLEIGRNVFVLIQRRRKIEEDTGVGLILAASVQVIFGAFLVMTSMAFLPQILVASLGSLQTFYSLVWHRFFNGIFVTIKQLVGAICICAGCILMYQDCKTRMQTPPMNTAQLLHAYENTAYQVYMIAVCAIWLIMSCYESLRNQSIISPTVHTVLFSIQSAMLGTQFMVMSKTIAMLFRLKTSNEVSFLNLFNGGFLLSTILVAVIAFLYWNSRVSTAELKFDISLIKPINRVTWIIFAILSGGLYFEEIQNAGFVHVTYACLYIVLGVWFAHLDPLIHGNPQTSKEKLALLTESDSSDEESLSTSESTPAAVNVTVSP